jgi:hypothetical protein
MGTIKSIIRPGLKVALILLGALIAHSAQASRVEGNFLGVFSGNDSAAAVATSLGLSPGDVTLLAKVDLYGTPPPDPSTSDGLTLSNMTLNGDDEATSGWWDYAGPGIANIIAVKAGPNFALYEYTSLLTGGMPNMGLWNTSELSDKGLSHLTAYSVIPEPSTALLLGLGLGHLAVRKRR